MSGERGRGEGPTMPARLTLNGQVVDRRVFLGALGLTAAGTLLAGRLVPTRGAPLPPSGASADPEGAWHVDDMWGHWPRYAHPIPYTLARHVPMSWDTVAPVDRMFVT